MFHPAPSPDGRAVAIYINGADGQGISIFERATGSLRQVWQGIGAYPVRWSGDSKWIYFTDEKDLAGHLVIKRIPVGTRPPEVWLDVELDGVRNVRVPAVIEPDERHFIVGVTERDSDLWVATLGARTAQ